MGRKKAKEKDILKYEIKTRVNEKCYRSLMDLKAKTRENMSELVRDILNNKPVTVITYDETLDRYMEQLIMIQKEINAIGVNINQVTHFFNGTMEENKKTFNALKISMQYKIVGNKVDQLYDLIGCLAKKWLQK